VIRKIIDRTVLAGRITGKDFLGLIYRLWEFILAQRLSEADLPRHRFNRADFLPPAQGKRIAKNDHAL